MRQIIICLVVTLTALAQMEAQEKRLNRVVRLFEEGKVAFGAFVPSGDIGAAVAARRAGHDFIILEMEHSNFDLMGLRDSLQFLLDRRQILEQPGLGPAVVPLVRVPTNADERNLWVYKQALDLGVYGVVTPHFGHETESSMSVIKAMRYPQAKGVPDQEPYGQRGVSPGSYRYWGLSSFIEYHERADLWPRDPKGELVFFPLIEDYEGVENLTNILNEVQGIAGIFVGEVDLATSLGYPGETNSPAVQAAVDKVLALGKEHGIPVGSLANRDNIEDRVRRGFQFLVTGDPVAIERGRKVAEAMGLADDPAPSRAALAPKRRLNRLIELFEQGKPVFGSFVPNGEISAAQSASRSKKDFVIFEMEHSGFSMLGLQKSLQYLLSRRDIKESGTFAPSVVPLVRVGPEASEISRNQGYIKQVLDYGVYGIVVPHLTSVQQANDIVQAVRYPQPKDSPNFEPVGLRGTAPGNAQSYWGIPEFKEYWRRAGVWPLDPDGEILIAPLIEDVAGAEAIQDILKEVKGIGCVFIGPADLATSMGYPGQPEHPEVKKVVDGIAQVAREAGVPFGITTNRERVEDEVQKGYQFLVTGDDVAIERGRRAGKR